MRLWSLHPQFLDAKGLVALWREALLAQAVLAGKTRGYQHHPQLQRFQETNQSLAFIASYLRGVALEARRRGYDFDESRIRSERTRRRMIVASGQLSFEWEHLHAKLAIRNAEWLTALKAAEPAPHPLFRVVRGPVAAWEKRP
jgi:hypothetical protein